MSPDVTTRPPLGDASVTRTTRPGRLPVEDVPVGRRRRGWTRAADASSGELEQSLPVDVAESPPRRSSDGRVVVDPRLRARRVEVRRDEGRRRLHRLMLVGGAVALVLLAAGVVRSPLLAVRHIRTTPSAHLDAATIERAAGIRSGSPMISLDQGAAVTRLEAQPWVATAKITRSWPGTVAITVTERVPVAQLHSGSAWYLLDATGRVLQRSAEAADLVVLEGLPDTEPGATVAGVAGPLELASRLPPTLHPKVAAVRQAVGEGHLDLALVGGGDIRFGSTDQLDQKIVAAVTMLDHVKASCLGTIDVQVPNAPTLTPASGCA